MVYTLVSKGVGDKRGQGTFCYLQLGDIFFKRERGGQNFSEKAGMGQWQGNFSIRRVGNKRGQFFSRSGGEDYGRRIVIFNWVTEIQVFITLRVNVAVQNLLHMQIEGEFQCMWFTITMGAKFSV